MLTIFLCFLACFLPLMIMNVAVDSARYPWLHIIASILAWASSVINPLIYAATNRQYRAAYGNLLKFCKNNPVARRTTWGSRTVGQSSNSPHYGEKRNPLKENPTKLWSDFWLGRLNFSCVKYDFLVLIWGQVRILCIFVLKDNKNRKDMRG